VHVVLCCAIGHFVTGALQVPYYYYYYYYYYYKKVRRDEI